VRYKGCVDRRTAGGGGSSCDGGIDGGFAGGNDSGARVAPKWHDGVCNRDPRSRTVITPPANRSAHKGWLR